MGLSSKDIEAVLALRSEGYFEGNRSIVEIGAQQISSDLFENKSWFAKCGEAFGVGDREFTGPSELKIVHGATRDLDPEAPLSVQLWEWLGFNYHAIDVDGSPGAIPLDLNFDPAPPEMVGRAALVTNCGTTEHIANQLNAMKVIHDLTAVGGVMIHNLPAQGYLNHGLVNYNPKFFWALSAANAYVWKYFDFQQLIDSPYETPENIVGEMARFQGNAAEKTSRYRFSDGGIFVVLQKVYDLPFVPPIDVRPGSETHNADFKRRYWSVFDTDTFYKRLAELANK